MPRPKGKTRRRVRELADQGRTPREISLLLGLSTQRIYELLRDMGYEPMGDGTWTRTEESGTPSGEGGPDDGPGEVRRGEGTRSA